MTKDIDTTQITPAVVIDDDMQLTEFVFKAASLQLMLNEAEARQQAQAEAAKMAYDEATREHAERIAEIFAGIEAYCAANRDRLFPLKGKKRSKTFAVLQHKLQYRSSESVEAPKDAATRIQRMLSDVVSELATPGLTTEREGELQVLEQTLKSLIRQPEPELNKDNVKALSEVLPAELEIKVTTAETFKLAFTFTPEQQA
jgi:phage host-nuclease inhibitor protein Gam